MEETFVDIVVLWKKGTEKEKEKEKEKEENKRCEPSRAEPISLFKISAVDVGDAHINDMEGLGFKVSGIRYFYFSYVGPVSS